MTDNAALQGARSAFPNLTPFKVQFVSARDFGVARSTKTPMKAWQLGSELFTAVAIADSRVVQLICSLLGEERFFAENIICRPLMAGGYKIFSDFGTNSKLLATISVAVSLKNHIGHDLRQVGRMRR